MLARTMFQRTLSVAVLGVGLSGGALVAAPSSLAAPGGDTPLPCRAEHTCALLIPKGQEGQATVLTLTPPSSAPPYAPLTPTGR